MITKNDQNTDRASKLLATMVDMVKLAENKGARGMPWDEAVKKNLCKEVNHLARWDRVDNGLNLREAIEKDYSSSVASIKEHGWPSKWQDNKAVIELYKAIEMLHYEVSLQDDLIGLDLKVFEPLRKGLWRFIDGDDELIAEDLVYFDLGDDGTDEMEQAMDLVVSLLEYMQNKGPNWGGSLVYEVAKWHISAEILNEYEYPVLRMDHDMEIAIAFLKAVVKGNAKYNDAIRVTISELESSYLK